MTLHGTFQVQTITTAAVDRACVFLIVAAAFRLGGLLKNHTMCSMKCRLYKGVCSLGCDCSKDFISDLKDFYSTLTHMTRHYSHSPKGLRSLHTDSSRGDLGSLQTEELGTCLKCSGYSFVMVSHRGWMVPKIILQMGGYSLPYEVLTCHLKNSK